MLKDTFYYVKARTFVISLIMNFILLAYVLTNYPTLKNIENRRRDIDNQLEALRAESKIFIDDFNFRLTDLEQIVHGKITPELKTRPTITIQPEWIQNRDLELRRRITSLEIWRMQQEK